MTSSKVRARLLVQGKVQGVFFRENTKQKAQELGLTGWVKNTDEGAVEAVFEGEKEKVSEIVEWLKNGPPLAKVENVEIEWQEYQNEFTGFQVIRD